MPKIYLSPSTQEFNPYNGGGNEEEYMNLIADAMIPYLNAAGIEYTRNTPEMTAASSIAASNAGNYDLHVALHSNAAGEKPGSARGTEVYYYPTSANGRRAADIISENLKLIYPLPDRVRPVSTTRIGEVSKTRAPAVLIEYAYHDNPEDAAWIKNNIEAIAENTVMSIAEYFGIPFNNTGANKTGTVKLHIGGNLNIRRTPEIADNIIGKAPDGARVTILAENYGWYLIDYNGTVGYVADEYISI